MQLIHCIPPAIKMQVLFFMIFLVYATIAPLASYILGLCFLVMGGLFRHQFIYIYKPHPDSGGYLYLAFIRTLTTCMIIAEVTITGLLALKKSPAATPLMVPLLVCTVRISRLSLQPLPTR